MNLTQQITEWIYASKQEDLLTILLELAFETELNSVKIWNRFANLMGIVLKVILVKTFCIISIVKESADLSLDIKDFNRAQLVTFFVFPTKYEYIFFSHLI